MPVNITAFVFTSGETPYLAATLLAVSRQTLPPKNVYVIDVSTSGVVHRPGTQVLNINGAPNLGQALKLSQVHPDFPQLTSGDLVWLLHDDSAPDASCLEEQVKIMTGSETTKVVGAKQRSWDNATHLLEVGIRATGSGRRLQEMDSNEIDQGQYDNRSDVLAVGTAAMLLDWDTYTSLEGFDAKLGPFGDGLEFCRRVHLSGYRVQVAPLAVVYHKLAGYYGLRGPEGGRPTRTAHLTKGENLHPEPKRSFTARRCAQLRNWMIAAPWWQLIILPLVVTGLGIIRVLWRIVTKEPRLATAELKAVLITVLSPWTLWEARRRIRRHQKLPRRAIKNLQIKGSLIWQAKTTLRKIAKDARKPLITDRVARQNYAAEKTLDRVLFTVLTAVLLVVSLLEGRFALHGVSGGALASLPAPAPSFWRYLISGWLPSGMGYGSQILAADPLGLLLATLAQGTGRVGITGSVLLTILGLVTIPLAWMCAWWATGVLTQVRPVRCLAALSWAVSPYLLVSLGAGEISVWVLAVMIPLFAGSLARACGAGRSYIVLGDGLEPVTVTIKSAPVIQCGVASLSGFVAVCASQILVVPFCLLLLMAAIFGVSQPKDGGQNNPQAFSGVSTRAAKNPRRTRSRLALHHFLIILMPSLWLVLPNLGRTIGHVNSWPLWVSTLGVPVARTSPNWWDLLTGWPLSLRDTTLAATIPGWKWLAVIPVTFMLILALASVAVPGVSVASHGGAVAATVGLGIAWLSSTTPVALAAAHPVTAWPAAGLAVYHAGLLMATVSFIARLHIGDPRETMGSAKKSLHALLTVLTFIPAIGVAPGMFSAFVSPQHCELQKLRAYNEDMFPATVATGQSGENQWRGLNLAVSAAPNKSMLVEASVWRGWRDTVFEASPWVKLKNYQNVAAARNPDAADTLLTQTVASLLAGDSPELAEQLASLDVNFVMVENTQSNLAKSVINSLDSNAELERVTQTAAGTVWRLAGQKNAVSLLRLAEAHWQGGHPSWPREHSEALALPVTATGNMKLPPGGEGRLLALSERKDPNFVLHLGSSLLPAVDNGQWNNLYRLPSGAGILRVDYVYLPYKLWGAVLLVWLFIALAAALPLRRVAEVSL